MRFATKPRAPRCKNIGGQMIKICDHPLITDRLNQMRDVNCAPARFRSFLNEIAVFLTYEAVRDFETQPMEIHTPLETISASTLKNRSPVLVSILRAGNGLLGGALEVLPDARVG